MRQGETPPKGAWTGAAMSGVKAPEPLILPDLATRFARTAERLRRLSDSHPMEGWLSFVAEVADAQRAATDLLRLSGSRRDGCAGRGRGAHPSGRG